MKEKTKAAWMAYINEDIIKFYEEGWTITDISNEVNETIEYVSNFLVRKGLKKRKVFKHKDQHKFILKEYDEGKSVKELAYLYNTPMTTVYSLLRTNNRLQELVYNGKTFSSEPEMQNYKRALGVKLRGEYGAGATKKALMEKYELSLKMVATYLSRQQ